VQAETIRVLLVDDDLGDFEMTRAMLAQAEHAQYRLEWASTYEEALDAFRSGEHDVYLLDYFLEDRNGLELLKEAGRRGVTAPVIMLTGRGSRGVDMEAMAAGAADYLVKGHIDPELLERTIRYALGRSRADRALRESEERHRSMFDHLPAGLYRSRPDGTFIDANPALIRILGYPDRDSLQRLYSDELYVSSEDRPRFLGLLDRFGVVRGFDSSLRRPDGVSIRVRNTARLHRDPDGAVRYVEGMVEDISGERDAEELRGSEARFRAVFERAGTGIALLNLEGIILEANPALAAAFHTTPRELHGMAFSALLAQEEQPGVLRELGALARGERSHGESERRFHRRDGSELWSRATLTLIRDRDGRPDHLVALLDRPQEATKEGKPA
jgi:PAS domain S-box-containing protein